MLLHSADTGQVSSALSFQPAAGGHTTFHGSEHVHHNNRHSTNGRYYQDGNSFKNNPRKKKRLRDMWDRHIHERRAEEECHGTLDSEKKASKAAGAVCKQAQTL